MYKPQRSRRQSAGFSLLELLIVIAVIGILSAISTLYLISSRRAANGASAASTMRVISQVQASYSAGVGNKDYGTPQDLFREELIDSAVAGASNPTPTMASVSGIPAPPQGPKSGFVFDYTVNASSSTNPATYSVVGRPLNNSGVARDGDRTFYVDQTGVIRVSASSTAIADVNSTPLE